jgi:hypothetical protein
LPPSDVEALRAYLEALDSFIAFTKAESATQKVIWTHPNLAAQGESLLQTLEDRSQDAFVAGVNTGQTTDGTRLLLNKCLIRCKDYLTFEKQMAPDQAASRVADSLAWCRQELEDLIAVAQDKAAPTSPKRRELERVRMRRGRPGRPKRAAASRKGGTASRARLSCF